MRKQRTHRMAVRLAATAAAAAVCTAGFVASVPAAGATVDPVHRVGHAIPGSYVVVLNPSTHGRVADAAKVLVGRYGGRVQHLYTSALDGFSAHMTDAAARALTRDPSVAYVTEDGVAELDATQAGATWGIDRIDQPTLPLSGTYNYWTTGSGVTAYVIDSGILTAHAEFGGRASVGADFVGDGRNGQDCMGHGTHVAGTIGGATYGVAKQVALKAVRVFGCSGGAPWSTIISGVDWVTADHQAGAPAVANMSIGGSAYQPVNDAITKSIADGVVYAVAAGNETTDACTRSPASTSGAITVAATNNGDQQSYFSNYGSCVDLYAPGENVTSAGIATTTSTAIMSGTSMATPHATGVAALFLSAFPKALPGEVTSAVTANATPNVVVAATAGTPNRLLSQAFIKAPATMAANLLANGSFETGAVNPWKKNYLASGVNLAPYQITTRAKDGAWFAEANTTTAGGSIAQDIAATPAVGRSYSAGVWVRSADGSPVTGTLAVFGLGGTTESQNARFTADGTWRLVTAPLDVRNSGHTSIRIEVYMDATGKNYDVDAAQLVDARLSNASFEMGAVSPWRKFESTSNLTVYQNAALAKDGAWFAEANTSTAGGSMLQDIAVAPQVGQTYSYSVWVRSPSGTAITGNVVLWGLGGTNENVTVPFTADGTWRLVNAPLAIKYAGHTSLRAQVYMQTTGRNYDVDAAAIVLGTSRF